MSRNSVDRDQKCIPCWLNNIFHKRNSKTQNHHEGNSPFNVWGMVWEDMDATQNGCDDNQIFFDDCCILHMTIATLIVWADWTWMFISLEKAIVINIPHMLFGQVCHGLDYMTWTKLHLYMDWFDMLFLYTTYALLILRLIIVNLWIVHIRAFPKYEIWTKLKWIGWNNQDSNRCNDQNYFAWELVHLLTRRFCIWCQQSFLFICIIAMNNGRT